MGEVTRNRDVVDEAWLTRNSAVRWCRGVVDEDKGLEMGDGRWEGVCCDGREPRT